MKRTLMIMLAMIMVAVCGIACADFELRGYDKKAGYQYISLGEFPQEADGTVKPILWRVLSIDEEQAYLLSEYILFNNRIHSDDNEYMAFEAAFNKTEMFSLLNISAADTVDTVGMRSKQERTAAITIFLKFFI